MPPLSRRGFVGTFAAASAIAPISLMAAGCGDSNGQSSNSSADQHGGHMNLFNPYDFGAIGDGVHDDTASLRATYDAAAEAGGAVELTAGRYFIPGNVEMVSPAVSLTGRGRAVVGGGEVRIGPETYDGASSGVNFSGCRISGIVFDRGDDNGASRCLVLRNVRGLDISNNAFQSAGKGIAAEVGDGNTKFHTTAMVRISNNRFAKLAFGVYGNTEEWDRFSDWAITDNYFNYCSDTSVWIAGVEDGGLGGVDGLNFAGNTIFSMNYNSHEDPLFSSKRYNLRLGKTNWLKITNNNFFEAGLSAVYLDTPQNFEFVSNHIAWPGQRELADGLEIRNGRPTGVIEGNTFAMWTRAAIGLHDLADASKIEVGQNGCHWTDSPASWTGKGALPGHRIFVTPGAAGNPVVRDFQITGAFDSLGASSTQSRDIKSPRGGVAGASRRGLPVNGTTTVFLLSDIVNGRNFGGLISVMATNARDESLAATYLLFVSAPGAICNVVQAGGHLDGADAGFPSFTWSLSDDNLQATPAGETAGSFDFDAIGLGAVLPS